jgi:hypothetical protein
MTRFSQVQRKLLILISRDCKLWISHISSKFLKIHIWDRGLNIKGRERNRKEKESAEMNLWTKVHGLRETRWHRFSKTGGTGFCRQHMIYPWLTRLQFPIHLFFLPLSPTTQNSKRRGREGDFLAIWGFHQGFQGLGQDLGSPTRLDRIPLHS